MAQKLRMAMYCVLCRYLNPCTHPAMIRRSLVSSMMGTR